MGREQASPVHRLRVVVEDWRAPMPGWSGRLGPLRHLVWHRVALPPTGRGRAEVSVELEEPVDLRQVVAAILEILEPIRPLPRPASPDLIVDGPLPGWLSPSNLERPPPPRSVETRLRRHDIVLTTAPVRTAATDEHSAAPVELTAGAGGIEADRPVVLVDAGTANPIGRSRYDARLASGVLHLAQDDGGVRWWVGKNLADPARLVTGRVGEPLGPGQRDSLANLSLITCPEPSGIPAVAHAATLAQLAMTGVLVHAPKLGLLVADLLGDELAAILVASVPADADVMDREVASVRQRRAALRHHATGLALPRATATAYPSLARPPTVTALLLTRRPDRLPQVLSDLAHQTYPELDIVVGLHGAEPTPAVREAAERNPGRIDVVCVPGELSFGEALGETTRSARGSLLTKVDDDDRYGPEHVWDLVLARHYSGATVVGKGAEFVYLAPRDVTVRRRMASELYDGYVAGGTILLGRGDLEAVGGWRPVERSVDRALLERVLAAGGLVYRTHGFGYIYVRYHEGHTWDVSLDHFDRDPVRRWTGLPPYTEFGPS